MPEYHIEKLSTPIVGTYDVIVVGGGVAGVSAAVSARRLGAAVLLIEKSAILGGLATLGHVVIYLPLCDGRGRKVIGGMAEELLYLAIKYGYDTLPKTWRSGEGDSVRRYQTHFNAPSFVLALDELVEQEGVDVLFDTVFAAPIMEDTLCRGVIIENKSGRRAYHGKVVVDATGDGDVFARAGAQWTAGSNYLSFWGYHSDIAHVKDAVEQEAIQHAVRVLRLGADANGTGAPANMRRFSGTTAEDVTEFLLASRSLVRQSLADKDKNNHALLALPGMAQFRTTRHIVGQYELTAEDVFATFADSVGCVGDWRQRGPVYEIPYRTLINATHPNLIAAGRIISAGGDTWEVTRVIPPAVLTGQAAGTAAALAADGMPLSAVSVAKLQEHLAKTGVLVHM